MGACLLAIVFTGGSHAFRDFIYNAGGEGVRRAIYTFMTLNFTHFATYGVVLLSCGMALVVWAEAGWENRLKAGLLAGFSLLMGAHFLFSDARLERLLLFMGVIFALFFELATIAFRNDRKASKYLAAGLLTVGLLLAAFTAYAAYDRQAMGFTRTTNFNASLQGVPFFDGVTWADPLLGQPPSTYVQFYSFMQRINGSFFVFRSPPSFTRWPARPAPWSGVVPQRLDLPEKV